MIFEIGLGSICLLLTNIPNPKVVRDSQRTCFREQKNSETFDPTAGSKVSHVGSKVSYFLFLIFIS